MDYKTDRVKEAGELKKRYEKQLAYYQQALERTTGKKVKENIIYSLALDEELVLYEKTTKKNNCQNRDKV